MCGGRNGLPIKQKDRYGIRIVPFFCLQCGHVYSKFRLSESDIERFYSTTYRTLYTKGNGLKSKEEGRRKTVYSRQVILPLFEQLFSDRSRRVVLEWGCSAGWNLVPFKEADIPVLGCDLDREYVEYGKSEFGLRLMVSGDSGAQDELLDLKADFLIMNHVLEHDSDPIRLLQRTSAYLKSEGFIFLGLPFLENLRQWGFRRFFHVAHVHYFSIPYFIALVESHKFRVVRVNKTHGYVLLQPTTGSTGTKPKFRLHNGFLLLRYVFVYLFISFPLRLLANVAMKMRLRPMTRCKALWSKRGRIA